MEQLPLISVIVPVYRVEKYLNTCIGSILAQTYGNLELILVDDGSPDGSGAICDAWAEKDSRIRVLHKENAGAGAARNDGLDMAAGALIAFVDSDDYIAPDMLQYLYSLLQQGADIAECGYLETEADDACFPEGEGQCRVCDRETAMSLHIQDTQFRQLIWNKLYRRETVESVRFPVGTKIDDEFFTYRVLANAQKLICSDKVCYAYRQQPDSIMHQKNLVKVREGIRAKGQRLAFLRQNMPGLTDLAEAELYLTCIYCLQDYLRELNGEEQLAARQEVLAVMEPLKPLNPAVIPTAKLRLLLALAQKMPVTVCRILNFLTDIHVLT